LRKIKEFRDFYRRYGIKKTPAVLFSGEGIERDTFYFKQLLEKSNWSLNFGVSLKNVGGSIGYEILNGFEIYGILANSWNDLFKWKFKPKVGIGFTFK
jgi:hypothetical protein